MNEYAVMLASLIVTFIVVGGAVIGFIWKNEDKKDPKTIDKDPKKIVVYNHTNYFVSKLTGTSASSVLSQVYYAFTAYQKAFDKS